MSAHRDVLLVAGPKDEHLLMEIESSDTSCLGLVIRYSVDKLDFKIVVSSAF